MNLIFGADFDKKHPKVRATFYLGKANKLPKMKLSKKQIDWIMQDITIPYETKFLGFRTNNSTSNKR